MDGGDLPSPRTASRAILAPATHVLLTLALMIAVTG
ncbi:MAG: hypothetical protein QOF01_4170 [Thermomicrobiales bacterium]|jgi:hypothetical protein|nr:hypothetical protein [Thermomicrobiales bacterium]